MSLQRSIGLVPIARSSAAASASRLVFHRGGTVAHRVLTTGTRDGHGSQYGRRGRLGAAVASALGLSLAGYYSLVADPVYADAGATQASESHEIQKLPRHKSVDSFALDPSKDIEELLKRYEETHRPPAALGTGIARYDITQVASNNPLEDDHSEAIVTSRDSKWSFFTVLDGHNGWETSALLREQLIASVAEEFVAIEHDFQDTTSGSDPFAEAIARAFKRVDDKIVHESVEQVFRTKSRSAGINLLAPAYAGACALLAFYDAKSSVLRVALTGDCRAVLGRKRADGRYDLEVLTTDQTANDPEEKKRAEDAHPGEAVVKNGRTMGFGPSRVFGDARWKWSKGVQDRLKAYYLGRSTLESIKTPPYFTAEPVVRATDVKSGDFVILATDGLWECLSNQDAVGLVGEWVHQQEGRKARMSWWDEWSWWGGQSGEKAVDRLPVVYDKETNPEPYDPNRYLQWGAEKRFVTVDANAATHLVRNALGGADQDLREALLSMRSPRARAYWDDLTATVVFFG